MSGEGLRFNQGKIRHDLVPAWAVNEVAKVFTKGAEKYAERNWEKGMAWSKVLASLKRHIAAFEMGEDVDPETGLLHMSHAATNALFLLEYYRIYPQGDDRPHIHFKLPKIALDIDGVLADFSRQYKRYILRRGYRWLPYEDQIHWTLPFKDQVWEDIINDKDFWINMPSLCPPHLPFEPVGYVTNRQVPAEWTEEWLHKHGFPAEKVHTVGKGSKADVLREIGAEIFVDDSFTNYLDLSTKGFCVFLFDTPSNKKYDVGTRRIQSLEELPWIKN